MMASMLVWHTVTDYFSVCVLIELAFFMRKGADVLSKWVGEAERQLRLLFEEAKNSQPSIIFFDEIDGLAVVQEYSNNVNRTQPVFVKFYD